MPHRWRLIAALLLLLGAVTFIVVRAIPPAAAPDPQQELISQFRSDVNEKVRAQGAVAIGETDRVAAAVERNAKRTLAGIPEDDARLDAFRDLLASYLGALATADADAYSDWMRDQGYTLTSAGVPRENWPVSYRHFTGRLLPENATLEVFYRDIFNRLMRRDGGLGAIRALSVGEGTTLLTFANLDTTADGINHVIVENLKAPELVARYGTTLPPSVPFWTPPVRYEQVLERDGEVLVGEALVSVINDEDETMQVQFRAFWDPVSARWLIQTVSVGGSDAYKPDVFLH